MSEESKKQIQTVKKYFETIKTGSDLESGKSASFDKELSTKIKKVSESAAEVVKHIEKKSG